MAMYEWLSIYWATRHGRRERNAQSDTVDGLMMAHDRFPAPGRSVRRRVSSLPVAGSDYGALDSVAELDGGVGALVLRLLRRGLELLAPVGRLRARLRARRAHKSLGH